MTIEQEILEELRRGTSLADLRRRYRSQSQLYGALREYLKETDKIVDKHTENLARARQKR
jgi:uncharacterized protein (DUF433 family)